MPMQAEYPPPLRRALIITACSLCTVLTLLPTSILNVALPSMQAELGATTDEISWSLTSYLVAGAVILPLSGFLTDRLGARRLMLACVIAFAAISLLAGITTHLELFVLLRFLQGLVGAPLQPLAQLVILETTPPEERPAALATWSMSTTVVPILGPTIGAWFTEHLSWHWCFYISLPIAALTLLVAVPSVPRFAPRPRTIDWPGFLCLAAAIAALQFTLDRGNRVDWFESPTIRATATIVALGFAGFLLSNRYGTGKPIFSLRLFRDRNFMAGSLISLAGFVGLFGAMVLQPLLMVSLLNYPVMTAGNVMMARGLASAVAMAVATWMARRMAVGTVMLVGAVFSAAGLIMLTRLSLETSLSMLALATVIHGFGIGLIMMPASTVVFMTLVPQDRPDASGLISLLRLLGQSMGISLSVMLLTRMSQTNWNQLGGHIQAVNPALNAYAAPLGWAGDDPRTVALAGFEVWRQASMVAMVDVFVFLLAFLLVTLPMVLVLRRTRLMAA
ncbi:MAG: MDR family MFS transporter [Gammaproteobacteria bacterium]